MKISDFFNPFRKSSNHGDHEIQTDRNGSEKHRSEIESNISKGLVPYIKRKGLFVKYSNYNKLMDKHLSISTNIKYIKWSSPKIIERANQTLAEVKNLKKEYKLKKEINLNEFKTNKSETKSYYKEEIGILKSASKRIIKTGHHYLI
jgi:hypothetical protein